MMKPEYKQKWIEALRSGKYKQGTTYLHNNDDNTYCCLGVLCDINKDVAKEDDSKYDFASTFSHINSDHFFESTLSDELAEEFGLDSYNISKLASLNDAGWSFEKIANEIERTL